MGIVHELSCWITLDVTKNRTSYIAKVNQLAGLNRDIFGANTCGLAKCPFTILLRLAKLAQIDHARLKATDKIFQISLDLMREKSSTLGQLNTTASYLALAARPVRIHRHDSYCR